MYKGLYAANALNSIVSSNGKLFRLGLEWECLVSVDEFVRLALSNDSLPFLIFNTPKKLTVKGCSLAKHLTVIVRRDEMSSPDLIYSPNIQLVKDVIDNHPIGHLDSDTIGYASRIGVDVAMVSNSFVEKLRAQAIEDHVFGRQKAWEAGVVGNQRSLENYLSQMFEDVDGLVVTHVNLHYKGSRSSVDELNEFLCLGLGKGPVVKKPLEDALQDLKVLQSHRVRLFDNLRRKLSLSRHLRGYVWVVEWSIFSGYSLHLALLFDTAAQGEIEHLTEGVGGYWTENITKGEGSFLICHKDPIRYGVDWCYGLVETNDEARRRALLSTLTCLAQRHLYARPKCLPRGKYFGTGQ